MVRNIKLGLALVFLFALLGCKGQNHTPIKKGEALSDDFDQSPPFYYNMPATLSATDTSAGWKQNGQKMLLTGTVFELNGETPAANVLLYYYQTDPQGIYAIKPDEPSNMPKNKLGQTHGYIRGWVKTTADGRYAIYTIMPGTYPSRSEPAHVHMSIKESNMTAPYYIDDFVFDNDTLLTTERRNKMENRSGSGVIRFVKKDSLWIGERNLILGLNIPNYPQVILNQVDSGKSIGEDVASFTPYHAFGPNKGTQTCPICKYGWYHGILYFVGNNPNWREIKKWLTFLDKESLERKEYLKAYFIYGNERDYNQQERMAELEKIGNELQLKNIALTFVPSFSDNPSDIYLNNINPEVGNTIIIYRRSRIIGKYVNLKPMTDNFNRITNQIDQTTNEYFKLSRPE